MGSEMCIRDSRARDVNDLVEIYEELDLLEAIEQDEQTYRPTRVLFYWPLGSAIVISFILALFSIPWASLAGRARLEDYDEIPQHPNATGSEV